MEDDAMSEMTPEQEAEVNRVIAEWMGWTKNDRFVSLWNDPKTGHPAHLPDFTRDRNALAEALRNCSDANGWASMLVSVCQTVSGNSIEMMKIWRDNPARIARALASAINEQKGEGK